MFPVPSSHAKGLRAEAIAQRFLTRQGYTCQERRYKTPYGELDLVMSRGDEILFVEVKKRPTLSKALSCLTERQKGRIRNAALCFLQDHPVDTCRSSMRFDLLSMDNAGTICQLRNVL